MQKVGGTIFIKKLGILAKKLFDIRKQQDQLKQERMNLSNVIVDMMQEAGWKKQIAGGHEINLSVKHTIIFREELLDEAKNKLGDLFPKLISEKTITVYEIDRKYLDKVKGTSLLPKEVFNKFFSDEESYVPLVKLV